MTDCVYYAIGDVHGEADKLRILHARISDYHKARYPKHRHVRVHLGDYVDRGPDSCGAIDYIMNMESDNEFEVVNLKGNHEALMLSACLRKTDDDMEHWLANGGSATVESYEEHGHDAPLKHHLDWLAQLPTRHIAKDSHLVFVHAGIDPESYPENSDAVHMWTRTQQFFDSQDWDNEALDNMTVIHGHTPTDNAYPDISADSRRINVDTGACYGGPLTAVVIAPDDEPHFLFSD